MKRHAPMIAIVILTALAAATTAGQGFASAMQLLINA